MRNKNKLLIQQLDEKLQVFEAAKMVIAPEKGWIHTIRTSLNMTREQLGGKLALTKGAVQKIEEREATGQITIHKLKATAEALDMQFVYGFFPKDGSIEKLVHKKAEKLARKIVLRTDHNMKLENQGIGEAKIETSISDLTNDLKRELKKSIWD